MFRWIAMLLAFNASQAQQIVFAPFEPAPGTQLLIDVGSLIPDHRYDLELRNTAGGRWVLGSGEADRIGAISVTVTIPRVPAGMYQLEVLSNRTLVTSASLTLAPAATLQFDPASAAPGRTVDFSAENLPSGQYSLFLEGLRVFGPQPASGSLTGSFVVPFQRTTNPAEVEIQLVGRSGRLQLADASASFSILEGQGAYTIARADTVNLPDSPLQRGAISEVTGRLILPPRVLNNPETQLSLVTSVCPEDGALPPSITECIMLPVNRTPVRLDEAGNFSTDVSAVSVLLGDATVPSLNGGTSESGLVFVTPNQASGGFSLGLTNPGIPLPSKTITVRLTKAFSNDEPIAGALVNLEGGILLDPDCSEGNCIDQRSGVGSGHYQLNNQFTDYATEIANLLQNPGSSCPLSLARGFTNANGEFEFTLDPQQMIFVVKTLAGVASALRGLDINTPINVPPQSRYVPLQLKINALSLLNEEASYGFENDKGQATGVVFAFFFDTETNQFHQGYLTQSFLGSGQEPDPAVYPVLFANTVSNTLSFALPEINVEALEFVEDPEMPGLNKTLVANRAAPDQPLLRFRSSYGYPNRRRFPDAIFDIQDELEVRISHDSLTFGALQNVSLFFQNQRTPFTAPTNGGTCNVNGDEYAVTIPDAHRLEPGIYDLRLESALQGSDTPVIRDFQLEVVAGPGWIASDKLEEPSILWRPSRLELLAREPSESLDVSATVSEYDIGTLQNDSYNDAILTQSEDLTGFSAIRRFGMSDNQALNKLPNNEPANLNGTISGMGGTLSVGSSIPQTLLDTGKIPLFRYIWGIPPIADATIGADFWFKLMLRYMGTVTIGPQVQNFLEITPSVQAGLDLFLDVSILFDIVSIEVEASPQINIEMPFVIVDSVQTASGDIFEFLLKLSYEVSVGVCPVCIGGGGTVTPVDLCEGNGCSSRKFDAVNPQANGLTTGRLSSRHGAVASNGRGVGLAAWVGSDGHIYSQVVKPGQNAVSQLAVVEPLGITGLDVVWFTREQGLMVWAQSALDTDSFYQFRDVFAGRDFDGDWSPVSSHQHLRYSLFDNGSWSAPANLTLPQDANGEGGVNLAVCSDDPARNSGCVSGGEALAVWSRDLDGRLEGNQRVYFSRFSGGGWSAPQPVDPGSSAKEVQPAAAYVNGSPVVVWVRNPTRQLADLHQRELAYRFLNTDNAGIIPDVLSRGVASPSVQGDSTGRVVVTYSVASDPAAFLGNRRSLHLAVGECSSLPCTWAEQEILDDAQRKIWVERPALSITPQDRAVMVFRHLGYGDFNANPLVRDGDSPGATIGSGELAMVTLDLETNANIFEPLTLDGGLNLNPQVAYDPTLDELLITSLPETVGTGKKTLQQTKRQLSGRSGRLDNGLGPRLNRIGNLPDLAVEVVGVDAEWPDPFLPLRVRVFNRGAPFEGEVPLQLTWDGPPDIGPSAWYQLIDDPGIEGQFYEYSIGYPEGSYPDEMHRLFVTVDADGLLDDRNGSNNQATRLFGQLPAPQVSEIWTSPRTHATQINIEPVSDPRVVGYRVYRSQDGNEYWPIGTTFTHGYLDITGDSANNARYRVTAFSARGVESSAGLPARRSAQLGEAIFSSGFEDAR